MFRLLRPVKLSPVARGDSSLTQDYGHIFYKFHTALQSVFELSVLVSPTHKFIALVYFLGKV